MTRPGPDAGSRARNPHGSGHGGEHRTVPSSSSARTILAGSAPPRMPLFISDRRLRSYRTLAPRGIDMGAGLRRLHRTVPVRHLGPRPRRPASTPPGSAATTMRSATWPGPRPRTGCANPPSSPRPASPSPNTSGAPSPTSCGLRDLDPGLPSSRFCKAGPSATTSAAPMPTSTRVSTSRTEPLVGLGSVCRRQATTCIELIISRAARPRRHPAARVRRQDSRPDPLRAAAGLGRLPRLVFRGPAPAAATRMRTPPHQLRELPPVRRPLVRPRPRVTRKHAFTQPPLFDLPGGDA